MNNEQYFWSLVGQRYKKASDVNVKPYSVRKSKQSVRTLPQGLDKNELHSNIAPPLTSDFL